MYETPVKYGIKAPLRRWHTMSNSNNCRHMVPAPGPSRGEMATVSRWYTVWFYTVAPQFDFTPRVAPWHSLIWSNLPPDGRWHMVPDNRGGVKRQQLRNQLKLCSFFNFSTSSLNISNSKERWSGFQDFGDAPKFQNWCLESLQNWMYTFPFFINSLLR